MDLKRLLNDEEPPGSKSVPKRPRLPIMGGPHVMSSDVRHEDYTIAWICALHLELAASRAMLDEEHRLLPIDATDDNTYVLGHIGQHNIVMACLPGQYGTNNAAIVSTNLKRSFPGILATLMVGIGGGSPSQADLYLGDVVIGTRVMQYDLGRAIKDGQFEEVADAKTPSPLLNSAVSNLRSRHGLYRSSSRMTSLMQHKMPHLSRPNQPDRLFQPSYKHPPGATDCDKCDLTMLQPRGVRHSDEPRIHYGVIASGNSLMKDTGKRDDIARRHSALCFEMEAAGMMDNLRCLPIRGISDYSDSHKNEEYQDYAAATAAAYARELLEVLPPPSRELRRATTSSANPSLGSRANGSALQRRQSLLESLDFPQINARRTTIKTAYANTCRWFLGHCAYLHWLDPTRQSQNHGFLWMQGKAGAGKSTMMKFAYRENKKENSTPSTAVASFFFNARGEHLEKSITGMYRSLLMQLFQSFPDLQSGLDDTDIVPWGQKDCPGLDALKELLGTAVMALSQRSFTCFIDALDECDEQEVRDMVQFFEDLAGNTTNDGIQFRVCFSSRPYPYINVRLGILLTLEDEPGHADDLAQYVKKNLRIKDSSLLRDLQSQILDKAAGIFMWVVLVVDILNKESNGGALAIRQKLSQIPPKLSDLFRRILTRDQDKQEWLLLCILWILCAKRPLNPAEFRHALWAGLLEQNQVDPELPDVTDMYYCVNLVITSSKGLAEISKSQKPTVQFIHESVRDFLVKERGLQDLWPDLGFEWEGPSHEKLKRCCTTYLYHSSVRVTSSDLVHGINDRNAAPSFLEYASQQVLYHADAAAPVIPQDDFLSQFFSRGGARMVTLFEKVKSRRYGLHATPLYALADKGLVNLIRTRMIRESDEYVSGERYEYPLFAALANGDEDAVAALLDLPVTTRHGNDIIAGLKYGKDFTCHVGRTPLSWMAQEGKMAAAWILIEKGSHIDAVDKGGGTPLSRAVKSGHVGMVQLLLEKRADSNARKNHADTALISASKLGNVVIAQLLLNKGADMNAKGHNGDTALISASRSGHQGIAQLLLDKGAGIDIKGRYGDTPLLSALRNGFEVVARLLINTGANIHARNDKGTALVWASEKGHEAVVRLLLEKGADVDAKNPQGDTALIRASSKGYQSIVRLLIEKGADVNAEALYTGTDSRFAGKRWTSISENDAATGIQFRNGLEDIYIGSFPVLIWASVNGHETVVRLLIDNGADVNAKNRYGWTALRFALELGHEAVAQLLRDAHCKQD